MAQTVETPTPEIQNNFIAEGTFPKSDVNPAENSPEQTEVELPVMPDVMDAMPKDDAVKTESEPILEPTIQQNLNETTPEPISFIKEEVGTVEEPKIIGGTNESVLEPLSFMKTGFDGDVAEKKVGINQVEDEVTPTEVIDVDAKITKASEARNDYIELSRSVVEELDNEINRANYELLKRTERHKDDLTANANERNDLIAEFSTEKAQSLQAIENLESAKADVLKELGVVEKGNTDLRKTSFSRSRTVHRKAA